MSSKLDIANEALGRIGQQVVIIALTDNSVSARLCLQFIDSSIREVLRECRWKSARKRVALSQLTATPAFGPAYQYQLPVDYIRIVRFNDTDFCSFTPELFTVEGRVLLTDDSVADVTYIADLTYGSNDINVVDALLNECFILKLAIKLCWPLQQAKTLRDSLMQEFMVKIREAKSIDAREERGSLTNKYADSDWLRSRFSC